MSLIWCIGIFAKLDGIIAVTRASKNIKLVSKPWVVVLVRDSDEHSFLTSALLSTLSLLWYNTRIPKLAIPIVFTSNRMQTVSLSEKC